jgi:hypothetical protein
MRENFAPSESKPSRQMRAVRVHRFGGLEAIVYEKIPRPAPSAGQVLMRVKKLKESLPYFTEERGFHATGKKQNQKWYRTH